MQTAVAHQVSTLDSL